LIGFEEQSSSMAAFPPALVDKYLDTEIQASEPEVRDTAAVILSLNMSEESFKTIASLGAMGGVSKAAQKQVMSVRKYWTVHVTRPSKYSREQMLEKVGRFPEIDPNIDEAEDEAPDNSVYATFTATDLSALAEGRRQMIEGGSSESVEGYPEISRILLNLINVPDLYKGCRTP
jgi:hypothetical protein